MWTLSSVTVANNPLNFVDPNNQDLNALTLVSGWVSFAGLQRFQRLANLQVLGEAGPAGRGTDYTVRLQVAVGYNPLVTVQDSSVTAVRLGSNTPWQVEMQMHRQTDQAFRLTLTVTPTAKGGDFSLTSLLARVGLKRGGGKLPAAQRG